MLLDIDDNYFYASTADYEFRRTENNGHVYTTEAEANMLATSFDTQKFALGSSESLVGTKSTTTSPHYGSLVNTDISQNTTNLFLAIPFLEGELKPYSYTDIDTKTELTPGVDMSTNWVSGENKSLQKIYFNDDMTKADTMHISTDYNQIIAVVPTEAYTVKWTTSNNTTYELSTFTTNIDTNQMLAHMGVSDAEIKSIDGI